MPGEQRAALERELVRLTRSASLGDLAADVAHDVANPLFGLIGLADLLLGDAVPESAEEKRLRLLSATVLELKGTLGALLGLARPDGGGPLADLVGVAREAVALVRHGSGGSLEVEERYPAEPRLVACPEPTLLHALVQLLLAARERGGPITVEVEAGALHVAPGGPESLGTVVAARIAADHGGNLALGGERLTLRLPPVEASA